MQTQPILQPELALKVWMDPRLARLPGVIPMDASEWLVPDLAFAAQMEERARLMDARLEKVHALLPAGEAAARELLAMVLKLLPERGYQVEGESVTRPDGVTVSIDRAAPLITLGQLVQDDLCLLTEGPDSSHLLVGAILCFPASWTLAEKIGKSLLGIHIPVEVYGDDLAKRVQRFFDAIRPGQFLMRGNALDYVDFSLHHPRSESDPRIPPNPLDPSPGRYLRAERQVLTRLPETRAVVFSIRTMMADRASLTPEEDAAFVAWKIGAHS